MANESAKKPMRCEYFLFLTFCGLGLTLQIWLLVNEFTGSSLPLITDDTQDRDVLPAITVCIPLEYVVGKTRWMNYIAHILESPAYVKALNASKVSSDIKTAHNQCRSRLKLEKSENK